MSMRDSRSGPKDSVTEVAEESFVRARPPEIERGSVLAGRYQVEDVIGRGGSGIVLRVFDRTAQNVVALKVLKVELALDAKWDKRFSRELRLGRPIQHPNVCRIFDIGEADGYRFLTMELAANGSLRDELKRAPAVERPIEKRMADARMVVAGLAALHSAGVVHRDFKPDNLLRMEDGRLVISDFGLATDAANAPGATVLIGTPHYMAPEVLAGEPATTRSDVWALGVVLHEIIFGRRPERRLISFDGAEKGPLRPTSPLERAMLSLCETCLADGPLDRPAEAGVVARLLESLVQNRRGGSRRRLKGWMIVAASVAMLGTSALEMVKHRRRVRTDATPMTSNVRRVQPTGQGADWANSTKILADLPGRVHCFSGVNARTVRIVWGAPRRAEDVDLATGRRRPSELEPESYRTGCPELSPSGRQLLFVGQNQAGTDEVRVSSRPDGRAAKTITSGSEAKWLGDDEFVYDVDQSHAAIFSLPTMTFSLMRDPEFGRHHLIVDNAVDGDTVALLLCDEASNYAVVVYQGKDLEKSTLVVVPSIHRVQFGWRRDDLLVSYQLSGSVSTLGSLDWQAGSLVNLGRYPGFDIVRARLSSPSGAPGDVLVARHVTSDLWYYDKAGRQKLTTDGLTYSGDRSRSGDLLLSKWNTDGSVSIWRQKTPRDVEQLTFGKMDVEPRFAPDGSHWSYIDYAQKSLMWCSFGSPGCDVLVHEDGVASSPALSPDGRYVAYVTQMGVQKLKVVSIAERRVGVSWDAWAQCPPVWSSSTRIWSLETSGGRFAWVERDASNGAKTGTRFDVTDNQGRSGFMECWPPDLSPDSSLFQHLRAVRDEASRLLVLK